MSRNRITITTLSTAPADADYCHRHGRFYRGECITCTADAGRPVRRVLTAVLDRVAPNLDGTAHTEPSRLDLADGVA